MSVDTNNTELKKGADLATIADQRDDQRQQAEAEAAQEVLQRMQDKATFFGMGFHQPVGILTPCANLKILCMQGLTAADILGNVKAYIRVALFTGLQLQIGSYPTDNIYLCHSSPFCLTAEISI